MSLFFPQLIHDCSVGEEDEEYPQEEDNLGSGFLVKKFDLHKNKAFKELIKFIDKIRLKTKSRFHLGEQEKQPCIFQLEFEFENRFNSFKIVRKVIEKVDQMEQSPEGNQAAAEMDQPNTEIQEYNKRFIKFWLKPMTVFCSNLTLNKLIAGIKNAAIEEVQNMTNDEETYEKLQHLKKNLLNKPLVYFENFIKDAGDSMIDISGEVDNLAVCIYDSHPFLTKDHIFMIELKKVKISSEVPALESFYKENGIFKETTIFIESFEIKLITCEQDSNQNANNRLSKKPKKKQHLFTTPKGTIVMSKLLSSRLLFKFRSNAIPDHPLLTDSELIIFIPRLVIDMPTVPYSVVRFIDTIIIGGEAGDNLTSQENMSEELTLDYASLMSELAPLLERMKKKHIYLKRSKKARKFTKLDHLDNKDEKRREDHEISAELCQHCILKNRKSYSKLRVILGYPDSNFYLLKDKMLEGWPAIERGLKLFLPKSLGKFSLDDAQKKNMDDCISAQYIDFTLDKGLFRTIMSIHCQQITSQSEGNITFCIQPELIIKDPEYLSNKEYLHSYWSVAHDYEAELLGNANNNIFSVERVGSENTEQIYLLGLAKFMHNKQFLYKIESDRKLSDKPDKKKQQLMRYKDISILKVNKINVTIHSIKMMAFLTNYFFNLNLSNDLFRFFQELHKNGKADLSDNKLILDIPEPLTPPLSILRLKTSKSTRSTKQDNTGIPETSVLLAFLCKLYTDISINLIEFKSAFSEYVDNEFDQVLGFVASNIKLKQRQIEDHDFESLRSVNEFAKRPFQETKKLVHAIAQIEDVKLELGNIVTSLSGLLVYFRNDTNQLIFLLNFLLVKLSHSEEERVIQVGLDSKALAKKCSHQALTATMTIFENSLLNARSLVLNLKQTKVMISQRLWTENYRVYSLLKGKSFIYKYLTFSELVDLFIVGRKMAGSEEVLLIKIEQYSKFFAERAAQQETISRSIKRQNSRMGEEFELHLKCSSVSILLRMPNQKGNRAKDEFLKVEICDLLMRYGLDRKKEFLIDMSDLQLTPYNVHSKYSSLISSLSDERNLQMVFKMNSEKNELFFGFKEIRLYIFFRVIDEILEFIDSMDNENTKSDMNAQEVIKKTLHSIGYRYQNLPLESDSSQSEMMKIIISFKDSKLYIPYNSQKMENIEGNLDEAEFTIGRSQKKVTVPKELRRERVVDDLLIVDDIPNETKIVRTLLVKGKVKDIELWMNERERSSLGEIVELNLGIHIPNDLTLNKWIPVAFIDSDLMGGELNFTVGHLMLLIEIIQHNLDEESEFLPEHQKFLQRVSFGVNLDSLDFNLGFQKFPRKQLAPVPLIKKKI